MTSFSPNVIINPPGNYYVPQDTLTRVLHINNIKAPIIYSPVPAPIPVPISELPLHAIYIHPIQKFKHNCPAPIPNPNYVYKYNLAENVVTDPEPIKKQFKLS